MNKITIDIPDEYYAPLKDSYYDVESYKSIMMELVRDSKSENFNNTILEDFREHYKNALMIHETAKINFEFDFVRKNYPTVTSWNATFGDKKVTIIY